MRTARLEINLEDRLATNHPITRRDFLRCAGIGSAALLLGIAAAETLGETQSGSEPELWIELIAAAQRVSLRSGPATNVWAYQARVLKGDPASVQVWPGGYLGPILHVRRGQKLRIDFVNHIDEPSIVNWHGLQVPADMMGLPRYEIHPGSRYRYEFQVRNRASTCWYHAMSAGHTPEQVYFGLAGLFLVSDEAEQALPLPRAEYDVPIVIQDRDWGSDNQFDYSLGTGPNATHAVHSSGAAPATGGMMGGRVMGNMMGGRSMMSGGMHDMMTRVMGFFGDSILVNGRPNAVVKVAAHVYRLRVLNASNSRTCKLAWQDGRPLVVIATGGGLLEQPLRKDYVMLAPGQRIELWADFSKDAVGTELTMMSLAFNESMGMMGGGTMGGMMSRMMGESSLAAGAQFPIFKVTVTHKTNDVLELPQRLSTLVRLRAEDAINRSEPRTFRITMRRMRWGFNDRSFQMDRVAPDEIVKLGSTEIWELVNNEMMAHAIHLHGLQFQVLDRRHSSQGDEVSAGYVDRGWEDTVLIMPSERVRLIMRFADFTGTYAYQCHMLEHAADGLMRNYRIVA